MVVGIDLSRLRVDLNPIWYQEVDLVGSKGHGNDEWQGQRKHTYEWVIQFVREDRLRGDGLITHRFRFDEYKRAVATSLDKSKARSIKVIFDYR